LNDVGQSIHGDVPYSAIKIQAQLSKLWINSPFVRLYSRHVALHKSQPPGLHVLHEPDSGWFCQFLEPDLKTPLPKKLTFAHADKIRELARRGEASGDLESKQALEHAIEMGRGGIYLRLTPEQYQKLLKPWPPLKSKF
jgi:hypothetical protein